MGEEHSSASTGPGSLEDLEDLEDSGADVAADTRPIPEAEQLAEFEPELKAPRVRPGQSLGRYVILRQLAAGGMSVVYVAYDPELNRQVALKVMRPGGPEGDAAASDRLLREAQAMAQLAHVNVVHVYDVGVVEQRVYMAMEYVRGETLEEWLESASRSWQEIVRVLVRAGRGLAAAHAAGLVHLDFKPRNVLVGEDGEVRVVDFGLARPPRSGDSRSGESIDEGIREPDVEPRVVKDLMTTSGRLIVPITQYGMVMGTPGYMAAEQLAGEGADARSDQFAFAATAWYALYGERPFAGDTSRELNHAVMIGKVSPPPAGKQVPLRIRKLLERGLKNDPDERHPALDELLDELDSDPARPARRAVLGFGALALVAAAGYGFARADNSGPTCDGGGELLRGVWDEGRRAEVVGAIQADPRPFAEYVSDAVTKSLDQWSTDWLAMYQDSCAATHIRGEQSTALLDLRTRCLRRRLGEVRALTDTFIEADATVVERATEAVTKLSPVEDCADTEALEQTIRPLEPEEQADVEAIYERLARADALMSAGKYQVALVYMTEVLLAAELTGYGPLLVDARHSTSALVAESGAAAEDLLLAALDAAEAEGLDDKRLTMHLELVFQLGVLQGEPARAHRAARRAMAIADRVGATPLQRSRLLANDGAAYGAEGRAQKSIELFQQALVVHEATPGGQDGNLASIHLGMGAAYHLMADYENALHHFKEARALLSEAYGERHPRTATAHENIGTALQGMGRFKEAIEHFELARAISEEALITEERQGTLLIGLAAAYEGLEQYDKAAQVFERVVKSQLEAGLETPAIVVAMGNLALVYVETGDYEKADETFVRQAPILDRVAGPDHVFARYFKLGHARALVGLGRLEEATKTIVPVLEGYAREAPRVDPLHVGEAKLVFARALHELERAGRKVPGDIAVYAARHSVDGWIDAARADLERAGSTSERAIRRMDELAQTRKKQRADQPPSSPDEGDTAPVGSESDPPRAEPEG